MQHRMQSSAVASRTPEYANAAAANDRRISTYSSSQKTLMNCLRDRTRNSRPPSGMSYARQDSIVLKREPLPRLRPQKLTLLKSKSQHDISRFLEHISPPTSTSSGGGHSSSSSLSSTGAAQRKASDCGGKCVERFARLESRVAHLEQDLEEQQIYRKDVEARLEVLTRRLFALEDLGKVDKRKKPTNVRVKTPAAPPGAVQPSKLVAWMNLSNLWKQRPSIETLKKQNIYNDEPCFDTEVELVLKHEIHKTVPKIVVDCCDLIEFKYRSSTYPIEGIYRQCGDYKKIQTLRFKIDANDYESLRQPKVDIHTLTGVLKLFLREIKTPLVSTNEAKTFIGKPNQWLLTELPTKVTILQRLIRSLPEVNRDTMEYLFAHFHRLTKVPLQQVSAETLSLSVTPSVFHTAQHALHMQDIHVILKESEMMADCVKVLIEYQHRIFVSPSDERRLRRLSIRKLRKTLSHPDLFFQHLF